MNAEVTTMTESVTVPLHDFVGGPLCVTSTDGERLYDRIAPLLRSGTPVRLSFEKVEIVISAFLNASVGRLYGEFSEDQLGSLLSFAHLSAEDRDMLDRVVENAKAYFSRPADYERAWLEALTEDDRGD